MGQLFAKCSGSHLRIFCCRFNRIREVEPEIGQLTRLTNLRYHPSCISRENMREISTQPFLLMPPETLHILNTILVYSQHPREPDHPAAGEYRTAAAACEPGLQLQPAGAPARAAGGVSAAGPARPAAQQADRPPARDRQPHAARQAGAQVHKYFLLPSKYFMLPSKYFYATRHFFAFKQIFFAP